jgi:hypothetical protein
MLGMEAGEAASTSSDDSGQIEQTVFNAGERYRAKLGLQPLKEKPRHVGA